jgi:hypothetical protein
MAHTLPPSAVGDLTTLGLDTTTSATATANVLVVGDGNFSYARAFLRKNRSAISSGRVVLTATSLDTHTELHTMYPNARGVLDELHDAGVLVLHGINATKLLSYETLQANEDQKFDRIVFNFPHFAEGGSRRNKIHRHRELLVAFFASAVDVLHRDGQIWVALCAGQGGTALDPEQRSYGDTWQIVPSAAASGLLLESVHACPVDELAQLGYYSVGYQLRERAFWTTDSVSHVFCRADVGRPAQLPIVWSRDLSFWVLDGFSEDKLLAVLRNHFPEDTMDVAVVKLDDYYCRSTQRNARTYSVRVSTTRAALTHDDANARATAALLAIEASDFADSRDK